MSEALYYVSAERLWDGAANRPETGRAVRVQDGRIEAVLPVGEVPAKAVHHVYPGCTLLPGLIDAHVHYTEPAGSAFLAAGVTTIRDVGNELAWILKKREQHAKDPEIGPTLTCCGLLLDGYDGVWQRMGRHHDTVEALRESVQEEAAAGVDQIKLYAHLPLPMLAAGVEEAHWQGKTVLSHLGMVDAVDAVRAGLDQIEHQTCCQPGWRESTLQEKDELIDLFLKFGTVLDPTLVVWDRIGRINDRSFLHDERRAWMHPQHLKMWDRLARVYLNEPNRIYYQEIGPRLKKFLSRALARGVSVGLGTDTPWPHLVPGFSVHDELALYVDADITPVNALRCATSTNAKIIGRAGEVGRIFTGFAADLLVVQGDPTQDIRDIGRTVAVFHRGVKLDLKRLKEAACRGHTEPVTDAVTTDIENYIAGCEKQIGGKPS